MSDKKLYNGIRTTARIVGAVIVAVVLFIVIQEYIEELNPGVSPGAAFVSLISSIDGMLFEWVLCGIALAGLILAYWKEGLGGGIALVCFIWLFSRLSSGHFNVFILAAVIIVSIPCILYLVYWWKMYSRDKKLNSGQPERQIATQVKLNREKLHFWTNWTLFNLLILILGYIVGGIALLIIHGAFGYKMDEWGTPLSQTLGHIAAGATLGIAVGLFQRSLLKRLFNISALWVYALIIGFVLAELVSGIILSQMGINRGEIKFFEYEAPGNPPGETIIYAIAGLLTGLIQWPILSRFFTRSVFWVLASTLGWGICFMITMISVWAFLVGALLYGAITGATLEWIMRRKEVESV